MGKHLQPSALFEAISKLVADARAKVYQQVNSELIRLYWNIGKLIIEDEQRGKQRASYGSNLLKGLAKQLTLEFGQGFDYTNLTNMRRFYLSFPIFDAVRQELSWTHYRILGRVENEQERRQ